MGKEGKWRKKGEIGVLGRLWRGGNIVFVHLGVLEKDSGRPSHLPMLLPAHRVKIDGDSGLGTPILAPKLFYPGSEQD